MFCRRQDSHSSECLSHRDSASQFSVAQSVGCGTVAVRQSLLVAQLCVMESPELELDVEDPVYVVQRNRQAMVTPENDGETEVERW